MPQVFEVFLKENGGGVIQRRKRFQLMGRTVPFRRRASAIRFLFRRKRVSMTGVLITGGC
jgi:hypothetical protein